MHKVLVVSPHRDDAAFSCAIAIKSLRGNCDITVANYFTISEYAPCRQSEIGSVSEVRRREDESFAALAGVALQDLDLIDAPQRLFIQVSEISTTRQLAEGDFVPRDRILEHIRSLEPELIFLPLAIGDHIDHRIAQDAAMKAGIDALAFYEDLPYTARASVNAVVTRVRSLDSRLAPHFFSCADAPDWKARSASLYQSQIDASTIREISTFCERYGGRERCWVSPTALNLLNSMHPE